MQGFTYRFYITFFLVCLFAFALPTILPAVAERLAYDDLNLPIQALGIDGAVDQTVSYTATSASTGTAIGGSGTTVVRIVCDTDCHFLVGSSPTATTTNARLPANIIEYIKVTVGENIAFIRGTVDGTASVAQTW